MNSLNDEEISQIITDNLERLLSGETTLEEVLNAHGQLSEAMRPELETALWVASFREKTAPQTGFTARTRNRLLKRIRAESPSRAPMKKPAARFLPQLSNPFTRLSSQFGLRAAVMIVVLLAFVFGTTGTVFAAQDSLPGEALYPVKRLTETVQYAATFAHEQKANLNIQFSERRVHEINLLVERGEVSQVPSTLVDLQKQMTQATAEMQSLAVDGKLAQNHLQAVQRLQDVLDNQTQELKVLLVQAPPEQKQDFLQTINTSVSSSATLEKSMRDASKGGPKEDEENNQGKDTPVIPTPLENGKGSPARPTEGKSLDDGDAPEGPTNPAPIVKPMKTPEPADGDKKTSAQPSPEDTQPAVDGHPTKTAGDGVQPTARPTFTPKPTRSEKPNATANPSDNDDKPSPGKNNR